MAFDYNSVLLVAVAAGVAFCFMLGMAWTRERSSGFLLTWAASTAILITANLAFIVFQETMATGAVILGGVLLLAGFSLSFGGIDQFEGRRFNPGLVALLAVLTGGPIAAAALIGLDGLSFAVINFASAGMTALHAWRFWRARGEMPVFIGAIAMFYGVFSASFILCGIVTFMESGLSFTGTPPSNRAEVVNIVCSVVAITGVGGLLVMVHQERISSRLKAASLTDPLTGLSNRRALFERFASGIVPQGMGFIVFDLDDFKSINDRYGHGFGDEVLKDFGAIVREHTREGDMALRLGGEEFALIVPQSSTAHVMALAERIRGAMSRMPYHVGGDLVTCTVSAGVAVAHKADTSLDTLNRKADNALYMAKRNGRNQVFQAISSAA